MVNRKSKLTLKTLALSVPDTLKDEMRQKAEELDMSVSELLRRAWFAVKNDPHLRKRTDAEELKIQKKMGPSGYHCDKD